MVLVGLVIAAALAVFIFQFGGSIFPSLADRLKTPEQRAREEQERASAQAEAEKRADKGAIGNTLDFIFGENTFDRLNQKDPASKLKQEQEAIKNADAELERQAQLAGFKNRDDAALQTDSGALVVGSSKNFIDFGVIGDTTKIAAESKTVLSRGKQRFNR